MTLRFLLAAGLALCLSVDKVHSAVIGTCTIMVNSQGVLASNPAITVLGSKQSGGVAATATVIPNSTVCIILGLIDCYSISSPAPASFLIAPGSGGSDVGFATTFRLDGGMERPGNTPLKVRNGTYQMQVDLTASKQSGIFTAGMYRAQVLIRCE